MTTPMNVEDLGVPASTTEANKKYDDCPEYNCSGGQKTRPIQELVAGFEQAHGRYDVQRTNEKGKAEGKGKTVIGPVTQELWDAHLAGTGPGLGIIPLLVDNTILWGCIDIDVYNLDHVALEIKIKTLALPLVMCRSKSGGAHLFVFFKEPAPAEAARALMQAWAVALGYGGCEIFPKQTQRYEEDEFGNWLNMPYFFAEKTSRYGIRDGKSLNLDEFVEYAISRKVVFKLDVRIAENDKPSKRPQQTLPEELMQLLELDAGKGLSQDPEDYPEPVSPEKVRAALAVIDPDIDRRSWFNIGCGLFNEFGPIKGFEFWNPWSKNGEKYKAEEMRKQWQSIIKKDGYSHTIATVFFHADKTGRDWRAKIEPANVETVEEPKANPTQSQQQKQSKSRAVTIRASQVKMRAKKWIWKGHLLRAALELLAGIPGIGKSQVQILYVACVTNPKKTWPDVTTLEQPGNVIMVTAEDSLDQEVVPRLIAAGADLDRVTFVKSIRVVVDKITKNRQFILTEEDLVEVEKTINEIGEVALVTIDPITAYMGGKLDSHKATEVRSQLGPLKDFAERNDVAVSAITHPAKNASLKAIDHFIGSQAFIAAARIGHVCIEELEEEEDGDGKTKMVKTGRILFCHAKHNPSVKMPTWAFEVRSVVIDQDPDTHEIIDAPYVVFDKEPVDTTADEAVAAAAGAGKGGDRRSEQSKATQEFLTGLLKNGPVPSTEVYKRAKEAGFTSDQIKNAKTKLGVGSVRVGSTVPARWDFHLPVEVF